jgi:hypothetical protein
MSKSTLTKIEILYFFLFLDLLENTKKIFQMAMVFFIQMKAQLLSKVIGMMDLT